MALCRMSQSRENMQSVFPLPVLHRSSLKRSQVLISDCLFPCGTWTGCFHRNLLKRRAAFKPGFVRKGHGRCYKNFLSLLILVPPPAFPRSPHPPLAGLRTELETRGRQVGTLRGSSSQWLKPVPWARWPGSLSRPAIHYVRGASLCLSFLVYKVEPRVASTS